MATNQGNTTLIRLPRPTHALLRDRARREGVPMTRLVHELVTREPAIT